MNNDKHIAVIGGGIAGIQSARILLDAGFNVTLVEKENEIGGHVSKWHALFPDFEDPESILDYLSINRNKRFKILPNTEITSIEKNNNRYLLKAGSEINLSMHGVVIACGFKTFDAIRKEEYGYGLFKNVITSVDLEEKFKKSQQILTAEGRVPHRLAIIHCVGSRDAKSNTYCSKVCCITGVKQAIEINQRNPDTEIFCFYMDLRLYGSKFDDLYLAAQKEHKIQFIRGRLSEASEKADGSLQIKAEDTLSGRPLRMDVDMIVLLVGMEPSLSHENFIRNGFVQKDTNGFLKSENMHYARWKTSNPGVVLAGTCVCPMSVNETLENSRSASLELIDYFKQNP